MSSSLQTTTAPKPGHVYVARYDFVSFIPETQSRVDVWGNARHIILPARYTTCQKGDLVMYLGHVYESEVIPESSLNAEHLCLKFFLVKKSEIHYMRTTVRLLGEHGSNALKRAHHQFSLSFYTLEQYQKSKKPLQ